MRWRWHPPFPGCGPGAGLEWPGTQPVPRPAPGAMPGVPWPRVLAGFTRTCMLNLLGWQVRKAGKRAAPSREAGAPSREAGRPKKAAAANAVLSMPCCSSPLPSPVRANGPVLARPTKRDAAPDRLCIDDARALLVGEFPHDSPPAPGVLFCLFPLFCLHLLPSSCSKQSREARPYDFRCNAFCLKESRWNKSLPF